MKIRNFDINDFNNLKNKKWMLGNNILYKMCSDYPNHTNPEEIRAKIWLIGRAYAASIERRKKSNKKHINDDFYDYAIKKFIKFNEENEFDKKLKLLKGKEFSEENLKEILKLHGCLTRFFYRLTGLEKRSLASKYLHFHNLIFPMYDSRASNLIKSIVMGKTQKLGGDNKYSAFCQRVLFLYDFIKKENGKPPTLREIDTYLIESANGRMRGKNNG